MDKRKESIDRATKILKAAGIQMKVTGCGCCGSPCVTFKYNGQVILDDEENALIDSFGEKSEDEVRRQAIVEMARERYEDEGTCEIDDSALTSEGDANGCYVQAWVWVDFAGTQFNKEQ